MNKFNFSQIIFKIIKLNTFSLLDSIKINSIKLNLIVYQLSYT